MNRKKRIIAKAIFAVLTAVMLFACKPEGEKVTGVVLDRRELKADIGQTVTLTATVLPAEAADPKVSWEAVPKGIVELTPDGALCTVKAVKDGAAVVTVTTEDGGFVTTCAVTPKEKDYRKSNFCCADSRDAVFLQTGRGKSHRCCVGAGDGEFGLGK